MTTHLRPVAPALILSLAVVAARADEPAATTTTTTDTVKVVAPAPDPSPAKPAAAVGDAQDVVFFADPHPIFLRMHVEVDGKGFESAWMDAMRRLHKHLDSDGDGKLSKEERDKGGWLQRLRNPRMARATPAPAAAKKAAPASDKAADAVETADDLAAYLRPTFGPFQVQVGGRPDAGTAALFDHLDLDHDKKLSKAELEAAEASLRALDRDDDEMISAQELMPYQNPYFGQPANPGRANDAADAVFVVLGPGEARTALVRRLLSRYDAGPNKDNKLSRSEIGLDQATFERADGDEDGGLDADELAHFLAQPAPGLELNVTAGKNFSRAKLALAEAGGSPTMLSPFVQKKDGGSLDLVLDTVRLEFNPDAARSGRPDAKQFYGNQFRRADGDNNKYLDRDEARRFGVFDDQTFKLMDRDGDGKLFLEEMNDYIDQDTSISQSRTVLMVVDQGRSIFDVLDANRDRRLGVRELRAALKKVEGWDRNADGLLANEEIPARYQASLGAGQSTLLDRFGFANATVTMNAPGTPGPGAAGAPKWFLKMDHNKDGDLSPREFLGPRADFERIDADHDGLIDPQEATKAGR
jgi:Ca2+-binding EF-hand superfamily protein